MKTRQRARQAANSRRNSRGRQVNPRHLSDMSDSLSDVQAVVLLRDDGTAVTHWLARDSSPRHTEVMEPFNGCTYFRFLRFGYPYTLPGQKGDWRERGYNPHMQYTGEEERQLMNIDQWRDELEAMKPPPTQAEVDELEKRRKDAAAFVDNFFETIEVPRRFDDLPHPLFDGGPET